MRRHLGWILLFGALLGIGVVAVRQRLSDSASRSESLKQVDDAAHLLFPFGVVVERQCRDTRAELGVDVRVVTLHAGGEDVAQLAERLFRERKVGSDSPTGGILVVLDGEGGQARIEPSYSLEGLLPDAIVSRIARDQLVPYASHRAAGMAVMDTLHFLRNVLLDAVASGEIQLTPALRESGRLEKLLTAHSGGAGAQVTLPDLPSHTEYKRRVPDPDREKYAPSSDPLQTAAALQRARRDLVGDPTLELFTEGSRVMRARYPVAPYEERLRAEATEHSGPLALRVDGDRAFLGAEKPARDFVPVLMVREQGLWRVDLVETFKSFFFDNEGHYFLVNRASPYAGFVEKSIDRTDESLAPLDLGGEPLDSVIGRLEGSENARDKFLLAEILLRNCFISAEALPLYAEAAAAAPHDERIVLTYMRRANYFYLPSLAIDAVAGLGPDHWTELAWLYELSGEPKLAREYYEKALARNPRNDYARSALARLTSD